MVSRISDCSGRFIVLDGPNGCGKSTQIQALKLRLEASGYDVVTTREPGGSPGAEEIRNLLVTGEANKWDAITELLLFSAARRNHIETMIKPALAAGKIVLCDRFVASTIAYQGFCGNMSLDLIKTITSVAIGEFQPDITVIFLINPTLGLQRATKRSNHDQQRYTAQDLDYHQRVKEGFLSLEVFKTTKIHTAFPIYEKDSIEDVTNSLVALFNSTFDLHIQ